MDDGSRQNPAYRATLLSFRRGGTKSPLTFLIYLKQFVTLPIASFPKFTGRKIGQSGNLAEKRAEISADATLL